MTTRTSTELKRAFKRFVDLVKPIEDVRHVVALDEGEEHIFTFIAELDDSVSFQVYKAEAQVLDDFPGLMVDFHVRYLEGRPLESFMSPLPPLTFSKPNK